MTVVATAATGPEAVEQVIQHRPDVVLLDIQMKDRDDGIEAIPAIKRASAETKVIMLTVHGEDEFMFKAFSRGADDYLIKDSSLVDVINAVRSVHHNELSLRPGVASRILQEFAKLRQERDYLESEFQERRRAMAETLQTAKILSNSELEIAKLYYQGKTAGQIAKERFVEVSTVRVHVHNVLKKFGKKNMKEVVRLLENAGVFEVF